MASNNGLSTFEYLWMSEKGCRETVEAVSKRVFDDSWAKKIIRKFDKCEYELIKWSKKNFGSVRRELENKRKHSVVAKRIASSGEDASHMQQLEK